MIASSNNVIVEWRGNMWAHYSEITKDQLCKKKKRNKKLLLNWGRRVKGRKGLLMYVISKERSLKSNERRCVNGKWCRIRTEVERLVPGFMIQYQASMLLSQWPAQIRFGLNMGLLLKIYCMKDQHFVPCGFTESLIQLLIWSPSAHLSYGVSVLWLQL